jgi:hypothetical protein
VCVVTCDVWKQHQKKEGDQKRVLFEWDWAELVLKGNLPDENSLIPPLRFLVFRSLFFFFSHKLDH